MPWAPGWCPSVHCGTWQGRGPSQRCRQAVCGVGSGTRGAPPPPLTRVCLPKRLGLHEVGQSHRNLHLCHCHCPDHKPLFNLMKGCALFARRRQSWARIVASAARIVALLSHPPRRCGRSASGRAPPTPRAPPAGQHLPRRARSVRSCAHAAALERRHRHARGCRAHGARSAAPAPRCRVACPQAQLDAS